ncbi:hypothetical protein [Ensifer aridi]|uniref:hypothetical protein n=1 Tax=Ensifer aridi TaxID=1708715 RepID=UPI0011117818|nr:hypothetical protein [Ensifer aridi]
MTKKAAVTPETDRKTCFVIMPISDVPDYPSGHFTEVYEELIAPAVASAGYNCELATSTASAHMIQLDVVTKVATADLCICDLSTNNPNVLFEYGIRQAFDKPTVLIKDDRTRRIFDLNGFRDIEYDHTLRISKTLETRNKIVRAINDTVNGSSDGRQVFSLVKLMQLTSAASLPAGNVDPQQAQVQLLSTKIDHLVAMVQSDRSKRKIADILVGSSTRIGAVPPRLDELVGTYTQRPDLFASITLNGQIHVTQGNARHTYMDMATFLRSPPASYFDAVVIEAMQRDIENAGIIYG